MDDQKTSEQKAREAEAQAYEAPIVVDYGDIYEITAGASGVKVTDTFHSISTP